MEDISALPILAQPASSLALPIKLAQRAADELLAEAAAANTTRSYASALRYWAGRPGIFPIHGCVENVKRHPQA